MELTESIDSAQSKGRSHYSSLLKVAVSALLLGILLFKSDLSTYAELIRHAIPLYLLIALTITVLSIILSAYKWQLLVKAQGFSVPLKSLTASYFVGLFFNNFMPTSIGGDVVRIYDLRKMIDNGPAATASVVAERVLASFTLGVIVLCGLLLSSGSVTAYRPLIFIFLALCMLALIAVVQAHRLGSFLARFDTAFMRKVQETFASMRGSVAHTPVLIKVLLYSLIFQLTVVAINVLIIKALGLTVPITYALVSIPIIFAITMLPVSLNGLGLREAMYAFFFSQVGLSTEQSVTISIFFFIIVTLVSLIGGGIFAVRK